MDIKHIKRGAKMSVKQPVWIDEVDTEAEELAQIMEDMIAERYNTFFEELIDKDARQRLEDSIHDLLSEPIYKKYCKDSSHE